MYVSLCGPHSLDTSTFGPTCTPRWPAQVSGPWAARYWYFAHHVGFPGALVCAKAGAIEVSASAPASITEWVLIMGSSNRWCGLYAHRESGPVHPTLVRPAVALTPER